MDMQASTKTRRAYWLILAAACVGFLGCKVDQHHAVTSWSNETNLRISFSKSAVQAAADRTEVPKQRNHKALPGTGATPAQRDVGRPPRASAELDQDRPSTNPQKPDAFRGDDAGVAPESPARPEDTGIVRARSAHDLVAYGMAGRRLHPIEWALIAGGLLGLGLWTKGCWEGSPVECGIALGIAGSATLPYLAWIQLTQIPYLESMILGTMGIIGLVLGRWPSPAAAVVCIGTALGLAAAVGLAESHWSNRAPPHYPPQASWHQVGPPPGNTTSLAFLDFKM